MFDRWFLFAFVACDQVLLPHWGVHGPCPHSIKVCILEQGTDPRAFEILAGEAGVRPSEAPSPIAIEINETLRLMKRTFRTLVEEDHHNSRNGLSHFTERRARLVEQFERLYHKVGDLWPKYVALVNAQ